MLLRALLLSFPTALFAASTEGHEERAFLDGTTRSGAFQKSAPHAGLGNEVPIFLNGFEQVAVPCGVVYTDKASFLGDIQPGFYEEAFTGVPVGIVTSLSFAGAGFAYTITAVGPGTNELFNDPDLISTNTSTDALLVTFTGAPVMAVAGNFWPTAFGFPTLTGDMILTLSDGTVETFPSNSPTVFRGLVTCAPITSIRIDTPDNTPTVVLRWPTLDNLIIGQ